MNSILKKCGENYWILKGLYFSLYDHGELPTDKGKMKVTGIPDESEERNSSCALFAITVICGLYEETTEVKLSVEETIEALEFVKMAMSIERLAACGLVNLDYENKDEYGFPSARMDKAQIKTAEKTIKRWEADGQL